jgi:hypothetical protein
MVRDTAIWSAKYARIFEGSVETVKRRMIRREIVFFSYCEFAVGKGRCLSSFIIPLPSYVANPQATVEQLSHIIAANAVQAYVIGSVVPTFPRETYSFTAVTKDKYDVKAYHIIRNQGLVAGFETVSDELSVIVATIQ